jgi:hypothetical protein
MHLTATIVKSPVLSSCPWQVLDNLEELEALLEEQMGASSNATVSQQGWHGHSNATVDAIASQ